MKPKQIWANLAVNDLQKTQEFYLALNFKPHGQPTRDFVSFLVSDDLIIRFFAKERLNSVFNGELSKPILPNEIIFSFSADSKSQVNQWKQTIENTGGKIFSDPQKDKNKFYDNSGYYVLIFADPDGHKFNIAYIPFINPDDNLWL